MGEVDPLASYFPDNIIKKRARIKPRTEFHRIPFLPQRNPRKTKDRSASYWKENSSEEFSKMEGNLKGETNPADCDDRKAES